MAKRTLLLSSASITPTCGAAAPWRHRGDLLCGHRGRHGLRACRPAPENREHMGRPTDSTERSRPEGCPAALVHPGDSVGLNGGTTTTEVAREIALLPDLTDPDVPVTLVTNAVNIANEMAVRQCVRVVVTGGIARARSFELTGPLASLILPSISVGTLFLGVEGLDERGAYAQHDGEAAINAALVEAAEHVVIVCDSSKLGSTAFALICPTSRIDTVITDDGACADQVEALRRAGVQVQLV